jgi:hypothetical protein
MGALSMNPEHNRELVRQALVRYPGIRGFEVAKLTGLSIMAVSRHTNRLRAEWLPTVELG